MMIRQRVAEHLKGDPMIAYAQISNSSALVVFKTNAESFFSAMIWSTQATPFIPGPTSLRALTRDEVEKMIADYLVTDELVGHEGDQFDCHLHSTQAAALRDHAARLILTNN